MKDRDTLCKTFLDADTEHNGILSFDEFSAMLPEGSLNEDDARGLFEILDTDCTGELKFSEFLAAALPSYCENTQDAVAVHAFRRFDVDQDGQITAKDLQAVLGGRTFHGASVEELVKEADLSSCGCISCQELVSFVRGPSHGGSPQGGSSTPSFFPVAQSRGMQSLSRLKLFMPLVACAAAAINSSFTELSNGWAPRSSLLLWTNFVSAEYVWKCFCHADLCRRRT